LIGLVLIAGNVTHNTCWSHDSRILAIYQYVIVDQRLLFKQQQIARFEREQLRGNGSVEHWSTYVGTGAPRFVLSFDVQTANAWFGQQVVVTKGGMKARDLVKAQFEEYLRKTFPGTDTYVKLLEVGPPVGRPVQYRVSGPDIAKVRDFSQALAGIVRSTRGSPVKRARVCAHDANEQAGGGAASGCG